jgi:hypothetical protein
LADSNRSDSTLSICPVFGGNYKPEVIESIKRASTRITIPDAKEESERHIREILEDIERTSG